MVKVERIRRGDVNEAITVHCQRCGHTVTLSTAQYESLRKAHEEICALLSGLGFKSNIYSSLGLSDMPLAPDFSIGNPFLLLRKLSSCCLTPSYGLGHGPKIPS